MLTTPCILGRAVRWTAPMKRARELWAGGEEPGEEVEEEGEAMRCRGTNSSNVVGAGPVVSRESEGRASVVGLVVRS